jgi:tRNA(Arg) A34 adenosine deaminase TadA
MEDTTVTTDAPDPAHLRRCIALAAEALDAGDDPFGSVLVGSDGHVLAEDRNRETSSADPTAHPEFALARWAAAHLSPAERAAATVYTSGEHCPMCAAAHAWVGLGRIVYAASSTQLAAWRASWGLATGPVAALPIGVVAPGTTAVGPVAPFHQQVYLLHERAAQRR